MSIKFLRESQSISRPLLSFPVIILTFVFSHILQFSNIFILKFVPIRSLDSSGNVCVIIDC